jgi:hypothetical protein
LKEARWLDEKSSLLKRLSESEQRELEKYNRLYLQSTFTKWRLMIQVVKAKLGDEKFQSMTLEEILGSIQNGAANIYMRQVADL